jgi:hypothetical protein
MQLGERRKEDERKGEEVREMTESKDKKVRTTHKMRESVKERLNIMYTIHSNESGTVLSQNSRTATTRTGK